MCVRVRVCVCACERAGGCFISTVSRNITLGQNKDIVIILIRLKKNEAWFLLLRRDEAHRRSSTAASRGDGPTGIGKLKRQVFPLEI